MNKRARDLRRMLEAEGLKVASISVTGGSHLAVDVVAKNGATTRLHLSKSPSDTNSGLAERSYARRFARNNLRTS